MSDELNQQMKNWLEAQNAYWQTLGESSDELKNPEGWLEFIKRYQSSAGEALPQQFSQLMDVLSAQSHNFNTYGEDLIRQFRNSAGDQQIDLAVSEFQKYMQEHDIKRKDLPESLAKMVKIFEKHQKEVVANCEHGDCLSVYSQIQKFADFIMDELFEFVEEKTIDIVEDLEEIQEEIEKEETTEDQDEAILKKLHDKGFHEDEILLALKTLRDKNYLNNQRYKEDKISSFIQRY